MNEDEKEIYNDGVMIGFILGNFILGIIFTIILWTITRYKLVVIPI